MLLNERVRVRAFDDLRVQQVRAEREVVHVSGRPGDLLQPVDAAGRFAHNFELSSLMFDSSSFDRWRGHGAAIGVDDRLVAGASAQVARDGLLDLRFGWDADSCPAARSPKAPCPGAQNPHWKESCLRNDRCTGVRPAWLNPSTVVISWPSASMARIRQRAHGFAIRAGPCRRRSRRVRSRSSGSLTPSFSRRTSSRMSLGSTSTRALFPVELEGDSFVHCQLLDQACPVSRSSAGESRDRRAQSAFEHHPHHVHPVFLRRSDVGDRRDFLRHESHRLLNQLIRQRLALQQDFDPPARESGAGATEPKEIR